MINKVHRSSLRWPGSKYLLFKEISKIVPFSFKNYHEPFVGSGVVFLNMDIKNGVFLSDANESLINFYLQIQKNLHSFLKLMDLKTNDESFYYIERDTIYVDPIEKAAQFYYLNRTCFNGIYRINSSGKFNVPYGKRKSMDIVDSESLLMLNKRLHNVKLNSGDFELSLKLIQSDDFVFLDPPYSAKKRSNTFLMYNECLFNWHDQIRLKDYCKQLLEMKVHFILTNLYHKDVFDLFVEGLHLNYKIVERYSRVGVTMNNRGNVKEYIFTNIKDNSVAYSSSKHSNLLKMAI